MTRFPETERVGFHGTTANSESLSPGPPTWRLGRDIMQERLWEPQERCGDLSTGNQLHLALAMSPSVGRILL